MNLPQLCRVFRQVKVDGGILTLKGRITQAVWYRDSIGRRFDTPAVETWTAPSVREARRNFVCNAKRWSAA